MTASDVRSDLTQQMYAAVGRAITQWSFVEYRLCGLFSVCFERAAPLEEGGIQFIGDQASRAVFYAVDSFSVKRSLVDAAVAAYVGVVPEMNELGAEWVKLSGKGRELSLKRNKLAHWFVRPAQPTGTGSIHEPISPALLMPPYGSPKFYKETGLNPSTQSRTTTQVAHIESAFRLYADKVFGFASKLLRKEELRHRCALQALQMLELEDRIPKDLFEALELALSPSR